MSAAPSPYKKTVGEGEICSQSVTLRKRHCLFFFFFNSFSDFAVVVVVVFLLSAGRGKGWLRQEDFERNEKQGSKT